MAKYVHRGAFVEAEQNKDGSYTISGVSRMTKEQFEYEFIEFPVKLMAHWDFVVNEERVGYYEGKIQPLYYNGYKCSNCGHGGGESIPKEYGEMTEYEANVIFEGMNTNYCSNCGACMKGEK